MARSRVAARAAGTRLERLVADYLAAHVDDRIDRRVRTGALDKGDIANLRTRGGRRIVVECKDTARPALAGWASEAEVERVNDHGHAAIIVHKRHGVAAPGSQWVTMTLTDFVAILTDERPGE